MSWRERRRERQRLKEQREACALGGHDLKFQLGSGREGWVEIASCRNCDYEDRKKISRSSGRRTQRHRTLWSQEFKNRRSRRRSAFRGIFTTRQAIAAGERIDRIWRREFSRAVERRNRGRQSR